MNIIYSSPLRHLKVFEEYANYLIQRWMHSYFRRGYKEVRILFDQCDTQGISPKGIERSRRDNIQESDSANIFECIDDKIPLPSNWMNFLKIRKTKHALCRYLSRKFTDCAQSVFHNSDQIFVTSGGFHVGEKENPEWTGTVVSSQGIKW